MHHFIPIHGRSFSMTTTEHSTVVGIFSDHLRAEQAVNELHNLGFTDDQISYVAHDTPGTPGPVASVAANSKIIEYMSVGAAGGAVAGGIVGAAASLTISGFSLAVSWPLSLVALCLVPWLVAMTRGNCSSKSNCPLSYSPESAFKQIIVAYRTVVRHVHGLEKVE
jgi:hypothetical protein